MVPALFLSVSCKESDIMTFDLADSAVCFSAQSSQFSLKGLSEEWYTATVPVTLIGPKADYDREFDVEVVSDESASAVPDKDFRIVSHIVPANELSGSLVLELRKFSDGNGTLRTGIRIVPNEYFKEGYPAYRKATIEWSEKYVRPEEGVWRYWYTFLCNGYSRALHELIIQVLGPEIEFYTGSRSYVTANPQLTMKMPTWWYEASRTLYQAVREHDDANPSAPLMHSSDYESYVSFLTAVGEGIRPDQVPTILETLNTL